MFKDYSRLLFYLIFGFCFFIGLSCVCASEVADVSSAGAYFPLDNLTSDSEYSNIGNVTADVSNNSYSSVKGDLLSFSADADDSSSNGSHIILEGEKFYGIDDKYSVKVVDENNNPLSNGSVSFFVNDVFLNNSMVDSQGIASCWLPYMGNYSVMSIYHSASSYGYVCAVENITLNAGGQDSLKKYTLNTNYLRGSGQDLDNSSSESNETDNKTSVALHPIHDIIINKGEHGFLIPYVYGIDMDFYRQLNKYEQLAYEQWLKEKRGISKLEVYKDVRVKLTVGEYVFYSNSDDNGKLDFDLSTIPSGNYDATLVVDDSEYKSDSYSFKLIVRGPYKVPICMSPIYPDHISSINMTAGSYVNMSVKVVSIFGESIVGAKVKFSIGNNSYYNLTNQEGIAVLNLNNILSGTHNCSITVDDEGYVMYCPIITFVLNVSLNNASVSVDVNTLDLFVGDETSIVVNTHPERLTVDFVSSNNTVVTVDANGKVIAVGEGSAIITVGVGGDGIYSYNCVAVNVTVSKALNVELNIDMEANVSSVVVGDMIKYTITVHNSGLSNATDVKVWDILPANVKYVSGADTYNEATRNATWTIDKIETNKSTSIVLVINVTQAGKLNNTVFTNSSENKTVVNKTNNNITVIPNVILSLTEVTNVTEAVVGDMIKYTITVHNSGLSNATDVKIWNILPVGVKYVSGADTYNETTRNATWTIDKIEAGKSASVVLVIVVNKTNNNITVIPNVILSLTEVTNVTEVVVGNLVKYTITVHNSGLSNATDVKIWNILPANVRYVSGADTYNETTRNATWTIDKIEAGKSASVVLVIQLFLTLY